MTDQKHAHIGGRALACLALMLMLAFGPSASPAQAPEAEVEISATSGEIYQHRLARDDAPLTAEARLGDLIEGAALWRVSIEVHVDASGVVVRASAKAHPPIGLDPEGLARRAEARARTWRYRPFIREGRTVNAVFEESADVLLTGPAPLASFPEIRDWGSLKIRMRRTQCYGSCPSYSLEIDSGGRVDYVGDSDVVVTGARRIAISSDAVRRLVRRFREARFFSLQSRYNGGGHAPSTIIAIEFDGRQKFVVDTAGERAGMPSAVRRLEAAVDLAAGTARWVDGDSQTLAALREDNWEVHSPEGAEILVRAAGRDNTALVLELVRAGAPLNDADVAGVIGAYAARSDLDTVRAFIGAGAFSGESGPRNAGIALSYGVRSGRPDVVAAILPFVRDLDQVAGGADAPLFNALDAIPPSAFGASEDGYDPEAVVRMLIGAGANVNALDREGKTPLWHARDPALARILIELGADLAHRDAEGRTALHDAIFEDY